MLNLQLSIFKVMELTRYDKIGTHYNATRKADPYITETIYRLLQAVPGRHYLDAGCGTGNYLAALTQKGLHITGVDPSEVMLAQAREKVAAAALIPARVEAIPLPDHHFDGAIAIFTLHHWDDKLKGLKEIARVLKPGAQLVCFSFTPEQLSGYWLNHYFPGMMVNSALVVPPKDEMIRWLLEAGFNEVSTEKYFIHEGLEDHFLYSGKYSPERYLDPEIRKNISSFTVYADPAEVAAGLEQLEADIDSGRIGTVIKQYDNQLGDYLFYIARH